MSVGYNVSINHFIRVIYEYENIQNRPGVKVFPHFQLETAKVAVHDLVAKNQKINFIDFYTQVFIVPSNTASSLISRDFGIVSFNPEEFLETTNEDLGSAIANGLTELDAYMESLGAERIS